MTKATFQNILSKFEEVGIENYMVCIGGDNTRMFNNATSIVYDTGSNVMIFSLTDNVGNLNTDAVYDITVVDYENISNVKAIGMSYDQGIAIMDALGYGSDEKFQDLIKNNKPRSNNNPGVGGNLKIFTEETPVLDGDGNPVLNEDGTPKTKTEVVIPKGMSHYIV